MTTDRAKSLWDLARAIESKGPGETLTDDTKIWSLMHSSFPRWGLLISHAVKAFYGSIDAAAEVHEALLSGRYWSLEQCEGAWQCTISMGAEPVLAVNKDNPARAWLIAILEAYCWLIAGEA